MPLVFISLSLPTLNLFSRLTARPNHRGRYVRGIKQCLPAPLLQSSFFSLDPDVKSKMGSPYFQYDNEMWTSFESIIRMSTTLLRAFSQIALAFTLIRQHASAPMFFVPCVIQPLIGIFGYDSLWGRSTEYGYRAHPYTNCWFSFIAHLVFCVSQAYERLASLHGFAYSDRYRVDRLSDNVQEYIERGDASLFHAFDYLC